MSKKKVLIFTEGGNKTGLGHISRCSSLYDELVNRGIEVELIINGDVFDIEIIKDKKVKVLNWMSEKFLNDYIKKSDYSIVDSYLVNKSLCTVISNKSNKCLFIDDNARVKYPKGIIVNPALNIDDAMYHKNEGSCYLLGPKYIILRNAFLKAKREKINKVVKKILIIMGGSDVRNITPLILSILSNKYSKMVFNVIIGGYYKNMYEDEKNKVKNVHFYNNIDAEEMKEIMLNSDIAVTAAGQTTYELVATETPFIPIKVVENQSNNIIGLRELNIVDNVIEYSDPFFEKKLIIEFDRLLNFNSRAKIFGLYSVIIDGMGSKRIIDSLIDN